MMHGSVLLSRCAIRPWRTRIATGSATKRHRGSWEPNRFSGSRKYAERCARAPRPPPKHRLGRAARGVCGGPTR
eukprot:4752437-Prymnesium_polylepis.1